MDSFEAARLKYEKNAANRAKYGMVSKTVQGHEQFAALAPAPSPEPAKPPEKKKVGRTDSIMVLVSLGGKEHEFMFNVPGMSGNIHGATHEKVRRMVIDALASQFGKRIEDVNDVH